MSQQIAKNLYFQSSSRGIKEKIEEVAERLGVSSAFLSAVENGKKKTEKI